MPYTVFSYKNTMSKELISKHTFAYTYVDDNPPIKIDPGNVKNKEVSITSDDIDMTIFQLFDLFRSYVLAVGYAEKSFYKACYHYSGEVSNNEWI